MCKFFYILESNNVYKSYKLKEQGCLKKILRKSRETFIRFTFYENWDKSTKSGDFAEQGTNSLWHNGNVVVFEYLDTSGNLKTLVQTTIVGNGRHAERLAIEALEAQNIPLKNIKKIYSELELCELESGGLGSGGCKKMILDKIGENVEIRYSYPYPGQGTDAGPRCRTNPFVWWSY